MRVCLPGSILLAVLGVVAFCSLGECPAARQVVYHRRETLSDDAQRQGSSRVSANSNDHGGTAGPHLCGQRDHAPEGRRSEGAVAGRGLFFAHGLSQARPAFP